jgi:DNA polymerase III subunit delta'
MQFKEIPGLESIKKTLIQSVQNNHVAHAQLFHGNIGSANLALAWAYATYINCENRVGAIPQDAGLFGNVIVDMPKNENDSCGRCASCAKMRKLIHPDFHHIFPTATTKKIKEAESDAYLPLWREFLTEYPYGTLSDWLTFIGVEGNRQGNISAEEARKIIGKITFKAYEAEYKILMIWQPEMLNLSSANALLKVLEEPPAKTLFLLVCNDANKLLTTILSRTQRVSIPAFTDENISTYLSEKQGVTQQESQQVAYLSEGNLAKALSLTGVQTNEIHTWFATWMRASYKPDLQSLVKISDEFDALQKERQKGILEYSLSIFRDLFLWQNGANDLVRLQGEEMTFVQNFSKAVKTQAVELIVNELNQAFYHIERNVRAKIVFLDLSLTIAKLFKK